MALERVTQQSPTSGQPAATDTGRSAPAGRAQHAPDTPPGVALGKTAKTVSQIKQKTAQVPRFGDTPAQELRSKRFKHQRAAARLLPGSRTALCLWSVASNADGVNVMHSAVDNKARYEGLQTCGSVWACPVCSAKVSEQRRQEMNDALAMARQEGLFPVLITMTARHKRGDSLAVLLEAMKKAKKRWGSHRSYVSMKEAKGGPLVGSITATEVTGGGANGWHPHFHMLAFFKCATEAAALAAAEGLREAWTASLAKEGLTGNGAAYDVQAGAAAGNYITKWGAAEELALGGKKKGRGDGRAPFQLLADYADNDDAQAGALFAEYAKKFARHRQLVWSKGLKARFLIDEIDDEEAADEEARRAESDESETLVGHFTPIEWGRYRSQRAMILKMTEVAGAMGFAAAVQAIRNWRAQQENPPN